ncbi:Dihydrofolate reductase [Actinokineospora alba]|uniref:Dihydrofolate reductase n=1 Tax=Actinokineospora alba TaxID=504798 RepID=A0A1H0HBH3_9PSEU|nr:dihydrofolate reductase family protein [Actinokineospora alba]TDP64961.1 dihydrofolate reductase [Actinokineospora alba]SDH50365.1 Dihydrofolate reductase [Actinokineospora alba]SDO16231.1 Dihydrofolate reductase [Actinokineospora alba]
MGKVIITFQTTADGSIGPEMGWHQGGGQDGADADDLVLGDAMLLGRKTFETIAPYWKPLTDPFSERVNSMPKYIASTTLTEPLDWNASLIKGDFVDEVRRLKAEHTGNLLSYGCGELAFNLVKHGLADEIHFWVHPIVWSEPVRPFHGLGHVRMKLKAAHVLHTGVILQKYEPLSVDE